MLYHNFNEKQYKSSQSSNINSGQCNQVLLLTDNKPFTLTEEEMKYINASLDSQSTNFTLIKFKLNKSVLTKVVRNFGYNLRNRKKTKRKRNQIESQSSDSEYFLSKNLKPQKKEQKIDCNDDELYDSEISIKSKRRNKKQTKANKPSEAKQVNKKNQMKDKYEKRFDKILSSCVKKEDNNDNEEEQEDEFVTNAQASAVFGEMLKALNKKQDKRQRKLLKEEERIEKRNKIMSFKQKIHSLSLSQIKELHSEFFKAINDKDNDDNNIDLNFEILTNEQINQFSTKLGIYENLNKLNKETHKTYQEELELIKKDKEAKNKQSNIKISGKDIPFLNDDDEDEDISSSSSSDDSNSNSNKIKDKANNEEISDWSFGNNNNKSLPINSMDKMIITNYPRKISVDDDGNNNNNDGEDEYSSMRGESN